jgi:hypothetical protein
MVGVAKPATCLAAMASGGSALPELSATARPNCPFGSWGAVASETPVRTPRVRSRPGGGSWYESRSMTTDRHRWAVHGAAVDRAGRRGHRCDVYPGRRLEGRRERSIASL